MNEERFDGEYISYSLSLLPEKMIEEAMYAKKRPKIIRWMTLPAAALIIALLLLPFTNTQNSFVPLVYNEITSVEYAAPSSESTLKSEIVTMEDINEWLGIDLCNRFPKEMSDYNITYYNIKNAENNEILSAVIWCELEDAEQPKPLICIEIDMGAGMQDFQFKYDVTTQIDGVTVIAAVVPGADKVNHLGEKVHIPERYYSMFDINDYHCSIRTEGEVSEKVFGILNNTLIDILK